MEGRGAGGAKWAFAFISFPSRSHQRKTHLLYICEIYQGTVRRPVWKSGRVATQIWFHASLLLSWCGINGWLVINTLEGRLGDGNSPSDLRTYFTAQNPALRVGGDPDLAVSVSGGATGDQRYLLISWFACLRDKSRFSAVLWKEEGGGSHGAGYWHSCGLQLTGAFVPTAHHTFTLLTRLFDLKGGSVKKDPVIPPQQKSGDATSVMWPRRRRWRLNDWLY